MSCSAATAVARQYHLHMLPVAIIAVDLVGDALPGGPVVSLLAVARDRRAYHDHDPGIVSQLLQAEVEGRILPWLYQQLIDHSPQHRDCESAHHW